MKKPKMSVLLFVLICISLTLTLLMIPTLQYPKTVYGSNVLDSSIIIDYAKAWWQKFIRHLFGQWGPAETASPDSQQAKTYHLPTTSQTQSANIIRQIKQNKADYAAQIQAYITEHQLPNRKIQADVFITDDKVYVTFIWTGTSLEVYDGWISDQNAPIWISATLTPKLLNDLYTNVNNPDTIRQLLLEGEAQGTLTYSIKRMLLTSAASTIVADFTAVELIDIGASVATICGWTLIILLNLNIKGKRR